MHCCCLPPSRRRRPTERGRRPLPPRPEPLTVTSSVLLVYRPPAAVWARRAVIDDARNRGATLTREHGCAALRRQPPSSKPAHRYVSDTALSIGRNAPSASDAQDLDARRLDGLRDGV